MRHRRGFLKAHGKDGPLSGSVSLLRCQKDAFFQTNRSLYFSLLCEWRIVVIAGLPDFLCVVSLHVVVVVAVVVIVAVVVVYECV